MPPRRRAPPTGARTELPPLLIVRKIILLQLAYYVSATVLILFTTVVYGTPFSLDLIFSWDALRGDITLGWMLGLVWLLNSLLCVIFLLVFVVRSKLIPDFALTIHLLHLIATTLYTHSIPATLLWWGLQCASAALMTFLGIWACQYRELRPITFAIAGGSSSSAQPSGSSQPQIDEGVHEPFSTSRGRGRERNLGEEYEMADMKGDQAV